MSLERCRSPSCPAAEESASFFPAGRDAIFNYWFLGLPVTENLIRCRQTFELNSTVVIAASLRCYLQIVQNWQGTNSLACDKLEPARRAGIQLVIIIKIASVCIPDSQLQFELCLYSRPNLY